MLGGEQVLHHAFMVFGVLCGGNYSASWPFCARRRAGQAPHDVGCRQAGEAVLDLFGEGNRPACEKLTRTSFQTVSESRRMPSQSEDCAAGNHRRVLCSNIMSVSHRVLGYEAVGPVREKHAGLKPGEGTNARSTSADYIDQPLPPHPLRTQREGSNRTA